MNNSDVLKELIEVFGKEKVITFAKINAYMNNLLSEECIDIYTNDYDYEAMWWERAYKRLKDEG